MLLMLFLTACVMNLQELKTDDKLTTIRCNCPAESVQYCNILRVTGQLTPLYCYRMLASGTVTNLCPSILLW